LRAAERMAAFEAALAQREQDWAVSSLTRRSQRVTRLLSGYAMSGTGTSAHRLVATAEEDRLSF